MPLISDNPINQTSKEIRPLWLPLKKKNCLLKSPLRMIMSKFWHKVFNLINHYIGIQPLFVSWPIECCSSCSVILWLVVFLVVFEFSVSYFDWSGLALGLASFLISLALISNMSLAHWLIQHRDAMLGFATFFVF